MSWSKPVFSSLASEIGWDDETSSVLVKWSKNGKTSAYTGFDEAKALELANAPSVGQMILTEIKPGASGHRYVG